MGLERWLSSSVLDALPEAQSPVPHTSAEWLTSVWNSSSKVIRNPLPTSTLVYTHTDTQVHIVNIWTQPSKC